MSRRSISTYLFALVVVRLGHRFLVIQERKHQNLWYFPGGGVHPGETLVEAARRETLEEAGIPIELDGILRVEYTPLPEHAARCRIFFVAHPSDDTPPKTTADTESLRACWATLDEIGRLPLRSTEVIEVFSAVTKGAPIFPLGMIVTEGEKWR